MITKLSAWINHVIDCFVCAGTHHSDHSALQQYVSLYYPHR